MSFYSDILKEQVKRHLRYANKGIKETGTFFSSTFFLGNKRL